MKPRVAIVVFPGSNCEFDCRVSLRKLGADAELVWHDEESLSGADAVVLPGGFAHGDYLRTGALARFSPIMRAVEAHAGAGGMVLGVCNGFQILCEAGLLPGALHKNSGLKFICRWVEVRVEDADTPFTRRAEAGQILRLPINHFEGNYYNDTRGLKALEDSGRIPLRYVENPNGSLASAAGIVNERGNVLGLMPHPERACDPLLGSEDGAVILGSFVDSLTGATVA